MSNKRSLNHHHQDHRFQISINETQNQDNSDERENHRIDAQGQFQISMKKLKFDLPDATETQDGGTTLIVDQSGDGQEKFQMLMKKLKFELGEKSNNCCNDDGESLFARLDENLLYEIFKHADARTLAVLSCVSKIWNRTAQDERLWELICTRRWIDVNHGGGEKQLRSVVLALGGFRRLYSLYLSKTAASTTVAASPPLAAGGRRASKRWGKDEVNLSLSLLSIQFYEKMNNHNNNNNNKGK